MISRRNIKIHQISSIISFNDDISNPRKHQITKKDEFYYRSSTLC